MSWSLRLARGLQDLLSLAFFAMLVSGASLRVSSDPNQAVRRYTRAVEFDYFSWTANALGIKITMEQVEKISGQGQTGRPHSGPGSWRRLLVSRLRGHIGAIGPAIRGSMLRVHHGSFRTAALLCPSTAGIT